MIAEALRTFPSHSSGRWCVASFSDGTRIVSRGRKNDSDVHILSLYNGRSLQKFGHHFNRHSGPVRAVAVSPNDCTVASASEDGTIKLWDANKGKHLKTFNDFGLWACSLTFSIEGTILASGHADNKIRLWSVSNETFPCEIEGHSDAVTGVVFVGDDGERLVSSSRDGTVRVYKWRTKKLEWEFKHSCPVTCIVAFPDRERIAAGDEDGVIRIWNLRTGDCEHSLGNHKSSMESVVVSRDGRMMVSSDRHKQIKIWTLWDTE